MKKLTITSRLLVWLLAVGFLASCSEDEEVSQSGTAPTLPPATTFAIESPTINVSSENGRLQEEEYSHAFHAAANYSVWQGLLELYLAHPVITFAAAANQEPRYLADEDRWVWTLESKVGNDTYQVDLYGRKADGNSVWEMYVSQDGGFQDILWLKGTYALDGSGSTWTVRDNVESPRDALAIEWKKSEGNIPYAKYTSIDSESDIFQNYIEYGSIAEGDFNVFYNVYSHKDENLLAIEYNNETKTGRVTDSDRFGDQAWYCWNSNYQNVACQ